MTTDGGWAGRNAGERPDQGRGGWRQWGRGARRLAAALCLGAVATAAGAATTYGYATTDYAWINNATHTNVTWGGSAQCAAWNSAPVDDDGTAPINIGFTFRFGTVDYTQVRINSNGRLQFNNNYCGYGTQSVGPPPTYPYPYPNASLDRTMRVYGADFCPSGAATSAACSGRVTYATLGTAPYRSFVVTWSSMREWNSGTSLFNVQMILYESGDFVFQYKNVSNASQGSGQIGYQLSTADYVLVDATTINSLAYSAIRFYKPTAPVAEYRFDNCAGGVNSVLDSSGNNLHGTTSGTVTGGGAGVVCSGLNFNGAGGTYVSVPHNALLNQPYVTVAAWARHSSAGFKTWETILAKGDSTYRLHLNGGCSINGVTTANAFTFGFNGGCGNADLNSGVVPVPGEWYHVVGTYDGATIKIFVNGVLRNSQALATTIGSNTYGLFFGENSQYTGRNWSGDIDEVKVFSRALPDAEIYAMYANESIGLQRDGSIRVCAVCNATLGAYNAFDNDLAAGTIAGPLRTKIAGRTFATSSGDVRLVALNAGRTAIDTTINANNVRVQYLDASGETGAPDANGCYAGTTVIATSGNQTLTNGVGVISPSPNIAQAYPRVRLRIYSPPASPTAIGCSSDLFAIRPAYFDATTAAARDADWQTAGTTRALTNTVANGGAVHAAGKPFSVSGLTARNAANATTTTYQGTPSLVPGNLLLPDIAYCDANGYACAPGAFSVGSWTYTAGVLSSNSATYSEVGAFTWEVEDRSFANIDAADSTKIQRYFRSNALMTTGRFVPASYRLVPNLPTLQTFGSACATRSFTYFGQPFGYATAPIVGLTALNGLATPAATADYVGVPGAGGLWKLSTPLAYAAATCSAPTQTCAVQREAGTTRMTATYALAGAPPPSWDGSNLATDTGAATLTSNNNGSGTLSFGATDKLALQRDPATPQAPYAAALTLALQVDDYSEAGSMLASCAAAPAVAGNPTCISGTLAATALPFDAGNAFRYGRLAIANAYGSELIALPLSVEAQYWESGGYYVANAADSCTAFNVSSLVFSNFQQNLAACETQLAPTGVQTMASGRLPVRLTAPGAGNNGSVDLALNVGSVAAGNTCVGGAPSAASAANLPWFGSTNPTARASFGVFKTPLIYRRENY